MAAETARMAAGIRMMLRDKAATCSGEIMAPRCPAVALQSKGKSR
jgi:hypothetical protein